MRASCFVNFVLIAAQICVWCISVLIGSVISMCVVGGKRHPLYANGILDAILIHFDGTRRFGF